MQELDDGSVLLCLAHLYEVGGLCSSSYSYTMKQIKACSDTFQVKLNKSLHPNYCLPDTQGFFAYSVIPVFNQLCCHIPTHPYVVLFQNVEYKVAVEDHKKMEI